MSVVPVAYITDVEGQWSKLAAFAEDNPATSLSGDQLTVAQGAIVVFGGDAVDRGPAGRRVLATLLGAKRRQPDQVVLLSGNRDINKLRLARELCGNPPRGAPVGASRAGLLRWILARTMGAGEAFEHRRTELETAGLPADDPAVVDSFLEDVAPGGLVVEYLRAAKLGHRVGQTLFVHGGVTSAGLGFVPGQPDRQSDVDAWIAALNEFHETQVDEFLRDPGDAVGYAALIAYQAPVPGTKLNQASVVYARLADENANPLLPEPEVRRTLGDAGIRRLVVGHTPSGDCPAVVRDGEGFELVLADNSYGRVEVGSQVLVRGEELSVAGMTVLDTGDRREVRFSADLGEHGPLGLRDADTGRLVKAPLGEGEWLLFRGLPERRVEQLATRQLPERLVPPRR